VAVLGHDGVRIHLGRQRHDQVVAMAEGVHSETALPKVARHAASRIHRHPPVLLDSSVQKLAQRSQRQWWRGRERDTGSFPSARKILVPSSKARTGCCSGMVSCVQASNLDSGTHFVEMDFNRHEAKRAVVERWIFVHGKAEQGKTENRLPWNRTIVYGTGEPGRVREGEQGSCWSNTI
jgi:hypothetical protein